MFRRPSIFFKLIVIFGTYVCIKRGIISMLQDQVIMDLSRKEVAYDEFVSELRKMDDLGAEFYIGTDSQILKRRIYIVTCVCAVMRNNNRVYYVKDSVGKAELKDMRMPYGIIEKKRESSSIRLRMLLEAYRSVEVAMEVEPLITGKLHVHLDIGSDPVKNKSSVALKELKFLIKSHGYECAVKPDAWAASVVADWVVKS